MTAVFLQVRLDSKRLPRKALLPLAGLPLITHAMRTLKKLDVRHHVLLTTTDSEKELKPLADQEGFQIFCGPKEDVLYRFILAADHYGVDSIVRATGDNPLVSSFVAEKALDLFFNTQADYAAIQGSPLGTGVEILRTEALKTAFDATDEDYDHEHVAPYLYNNPDRFRIEIRQIEQDFLCSEKVTVDTEDDYRKITDLYSQLYSGAEIPLRPLIRYLSKRGFES